jgi:hypothetical protein
MKMTDQNVDNLQRKQALQEVVKILIHEIKQDEPTTLNVNLAMVLLRKWLADHHAKIEDAKPLHKDFADTWRHHPKYRRPFSNPNDELEALEWGNTTYNLILKELGDDGTKHSHLYYEALHAQCVADARRLLRDREYYTKVIGDDEGFEPLKH